jgi:hypothetical protein
MRKTRWTQNMSAANFNSARRLVRDFAEERVDKHPGNTATSFRMPILDEVVALADGGNGDLELLASAFIVMHNWITTEARAISAMTGIPIAEVIDGCDRAIRTGTTWNLRVRPSETAANSNSSNGLLRTVDRDDRGLITEVEEHPV